MQPTAKEGTYRKWALPDNEKRARQNVDAIGGPLEVLGVRCEEIDVGDDLRGSHGAERGRQNRAGGEDAGELHFDRLRF